VSKKMRKIGKPYFIFIRTYLFHLFFIALSVLLIGLSVPNLNAQNKGEVEIKASIGADKIGMDDVLLYTITLKGINNPQQPNLADLEGFKVAQSSRNTEFRFVNGVSSYYTNFVYYLTPLKTGVFILPPVAYSYQGRDFKTQTFTVKVVEGSVTSQQQKPRRRRFPSIFDDDDFFSSPFKKAQPQAIDVRLVPEISKRTAFKGEQIILRLRLYTRNSVQSVDMVSNQSIPGFWQEWFPLPKSIPGENKTIKGKVYQVYEVRKVALFPTKSGKITIPSLKFQLVLRDAMSFFSSPQRIIRSTPEIVVQVNDPPPVAAGLPVGRFNLSVRPGKRELDINDMLTIKVRVSGKGNLKTLSPPEFQNNDFFKVYSPKISRNVSKQDKGISGHVEAEVPVAFKKSGLISFPALQFKYFDPQKGKTVALKTDPMMIKVTGHKEKQETVSSVAQTEIIKTGEDIDFIKKGDLYNQEKNLYHSKLFLILMLIPFLLNLLLLLKIAAFDRFIVNNSILTGRKRLNRAIDALRRVKDSAGISPILETYLKEKAGLGLSAISNQGIDQLLAKHGVLDNDIKSFIRLKTESESSRFSPEKAVKKSNKELKHNIKMLTEILKRIDGRIK
jgi:BatD DUF11 like domain